MGISVGWDLIYWHLSGVGPNILASQWGGAHFIGILSGDGALLYWHLSWAGPNILASQWGGA